MPYEKFVEPWPNASKHPTMLGCMPPFYFLVGVGSIWRCDYCNQLWERTAGTPAWTKVFECPHWAPGSVTFRKGCTACEAPQPSEPDHASGDRDA